MTAQPAAAEDWVKVGESKDGKRITLIDKDSIKVVDGRVRHWTKLEDYSPPGTLTGKTIHSHVTDCKAETQASTSIHSYENDKLVFSHTEPPDTKLDFRAYPPSTIGASGIAFICRIIKNGWLPFPQLDGSAQWEEVPARSDSFINKESIRVVDGMVRYQQKTVYESGYLKPEMAANCADLTLAVTEVLSFDFSKKFMPNLSVNLEIEHPPLKFQRAEGGSEPLRKFACDYVQAQARVVRGSRKARR